MRSATVRLLLPATAMALVCVTTIAQQTPAERAPVASTPSSDTIKRAKAVGLRPEVRKGVTVYCWESADIGTRFKTKKCVGENQLLDRIDQLEAERQNKQQTH